MENNMIAKVETTLKNNLAQALERVIEAENLDIDLKNLPEIEVEVPREQEHGDYASNLALVFARFFQRSPRELAEVIVDNFSCDLVKDISVAGPGFINFNLNNRWLYQTLELIRKKGTAYGKGNYGQQQSLQLEFVSANPTGPLHVGHSRGAVVGDVLANILQAVGYQVEKEYYVNDAGRQMEILGESTLIRYQQLCGQEVELPEAAYAGQYLQDIAADIKDEYGEELLQKTREEQLRFCQDYTYKNMLARIKDDLHRYGIEFDSWFSERDLHQGKIKEAIEYLREKDYIFKEEGALWFKSADFGDDKDRVVIKSDGSPTYLAADIAYHYNKIQRGFDKLINVWGADHHGYIPRVKAVVEAFGCDRDKLEVIIVQMVTLLRSGKKVPMSKRAGEFVTMRDVVDEVGRDAARYFYIMRSTDSHLDFDLELAKEQSTNNPVYYVQYAHARIYSIIENAAAEGYDPESIENNDLDLPLLKTEEELELMKLLARFPEEIKISAVGRQPHQLTEYAHQLANAFHVFYNKRRVISDDKALSSSRIYLVMAVRQVLKNLLSLLGISAPDHM